MRKKVSCSGRKVEENKFCKLLNQSCKKANLKANPNTELVAKVMIGHTDIVTDLVKSAIGSKNQID